MSKINVTSLRPRSLLHWTGLPVKAFLALVAWRTNLTNRQLSDLFGVGVGVATVHRIIDRLTPLIAQLLDPPDDRRSELWVVDGTLIPLHDQTKCAACPVSRFFGRSATRPESLRACRAP
ncbi:transposase family protein [Streptomyces sp. ISL-100]|uniref:helix-turn-helix domain-containing protein n=1 Tax=Streptomyces sp. ISL-100 TaxID=2819173 RepID=UPI001BECA397|nr:transposase family protein [Streptomyces sp. ISL-100]MBT2401155.1 transposase family protein [Streptomyces sp. ISL-100]